MLLKRDYLYENNGKVWIDSYVPANPAKSKRPAMLIFPGGAYRYCSRREAEPVAKFFLDKGFNAYVLEYTLIDDFKWPEAPFDPLKDAMLAVKFIKDHAEEHITDTAKIACIGFSAGGHLAGMLATCDNDKELLDSLQLSAEDVKPAAAILSYALISALYQIDEAHPDELPDDWNEYWMNDHCSVDKRVNPTTCPVFLWHTVPDDCVPVKSSIYTAMALADNKVPFEMHNYPAGWHGLSVCTADTEGRRDIPDVVRYASSWKDEVMLWLENTLSL